MDLGRFINKSKRILFLLFVPAVSFCHFHPISSSTAYVRWYLAGGEYVKHHPSSGYPDTRHHQTKSSGNGRDMEY
jgi:hypothetical protein